MAVARRLFAGAAVQTTLVSSISAADVTISITADVGWPTGAEEFFVVIEPDQANEEKVLVTRSGTVLTALSTAKRGVDGTAASSHPAGSVVYPCVSATDLNEANTLTSTLTTKGDLLVQTASATVRLGVGSNGQVLFADSAVVEGVRWASLDLDDVDDVDAAAPSDGDVLTYSSSSGNWEPVAPTVPEDPIGLILALGG
jgi:hypothetical protein